MSDSVYITSFLPLSVLSFFLYSVHLLVAHHLASTHIGSCSFHSPLWEASSGASLSLDGTITTHRETPSENHHTARFDAPLCLTHRNLAPIPMRTWSQPLATRL